MSKTLYTGRRELVRPNTLIIKSSSGLTLKPMIMRGERIMIEIKKKKLYSKPSNLLP